MTSKPQGYDNLKVHPEAADIFRATIELCTKKRRIRPTHSEALCMMAEAWTRELKAA